MDTHQYKVEFPGGETTELAANIIAELMYAQCDVDGNEYLLLQACNDHRNNGSALNVKNKKKLSKGKKSSESQQLVGTYVASGRRSTAWETLSNLKELYPIQVDKYLIAQGINH